MTNLIQKHLGIVDYKPTWENMRKLTTERDKNTPDEIWYLQHPPVYTQGQAGKPEHILNPQSIPVIQTDRGGQVTYHGPGQLVVYCMLDIQRMNIGIRNLVTLLERSLIELLALYDIKAGTQCGAPGVYVDNAKIASIGLRVKKGCTYHGIALNLDMDLQPFYGINPCGFEKMKMVQMKDFIDNLSFTNVTQEYQSILTGSLRKYLCSSSQNMCNL